MNGVDRPDLLPSSNFKHINATCVRIIRDRRGAGCIRDALKKLGVERLTTVRAFGTVRKARGLFLDIDRYIYDIRMESEAETHRSVISWSDRTTRGGFNAFFASCFPLYVFSECAYNMTSSI